MDTRSYPTQPTDREFIPLMEGTRDASEREPQWRWRYRDLEWWQGAERFAQRRAVRARQRAARKLNAATQAESELLTDEQPPAVERPADGA